jgi:hypothetical protein
MTTHGTDADIRALPFGTAVRCALAMHTCPISFWAVVERREMIPGISPAGLLRMALPWWAKYAALAALVAALWLHGWTTGREGVREDWEAATAREQAAHLADVQRLAKAASEIELVWQNTTTTVRERAKVITREVPVYVTKESDARCLVPVGLERLWHLDLQALLDPAAAGSGNDAASRLALSDVARGVVEAKERFALNRATAEACQAWVREVVTRWSPPDT